MQQLRTKFKACLSSWTRFSPLSNFNSRRASCSSSIWSNPVIKSSFKILLLGPLTRSYTSWGGKSTKKLYWLKVLMSNLKNSSRWFSSCCLTKYFIIILVISFPEMPISSRAYLNSSIKSLPVSIFYSISSSNCTNIYSLMLKRYLVSIWGSFTSDPLIWSSISSSVLFSVGVFEPCFMDRIVSTMWTW